MNKILWWLYVVWQSLKWVNKITLGSNVKYKGEVWQIYNGVCAPSYDLINKKKETDLVSKDDFKLIQNLKEWLFRFCFMYRFYMLAWYRIWVNDGMKAWMKKCNIFAR